MHQSTHAEAAGFVSASPCFQHFTIHMKTYFRDLSLFDIFLEHMNDSHQCGLVVCGSLKAKKKRNG